jgi:hypothetical protein
VTEFVAVRRSECERSEVACQVGIAPSGKGFLVERESDGRVLWPPAASSSCTVGPVAPSEAGECLLPTEGQSRRLNFCQNHNTSIRLKLINYAN